MDITKVPYFLNLIKDTEGRARACRLIVKYAQRDSDGSAKLVQKLITTLNSVTQRVANYVEGTPDEEAKQALHVRNSLPYLLDGLLLTLHESEHLQALVVLRVKYQRCLGNMRNLARLRDLLRSVRHARDEDECIEWLESNLDLVRCDDCGLLEYRGKITETYEDQEICRECIDSAYTFSTHYDKYVYNDNGRWAYNASGDEVFIDVDDDDFHFDDDLDRYVHYNYVPPAPPLIGTYHSSKSNHVPQNDSWSASKHRWFGVELEVEIKDRAVDREEKAKHLHDVINGGERGAKVFFENDGSLSYGFEIITQPMSLPAHREMWSWLKVKDNTRYLLSHNTSTCGLHVHVNKDGLSQIQIAKIVTFVNDSRNSDLIRAIARRYGEGYCKIKQKDLSSAHQSTDRYEAVNITGRRTIEFRIFKGSLKYESVVSAIEFCNALVEFAASDKTGDVSALNADDFIDFINSNQAEETAILRPYLDAVLQTA